MQIQMKILDNGDLMITREFDDQEEREEILNETMNQQALTVGYELYKNDFRLMTDGEKIDRGDLTGSDILSDIVEGDLDGDWNSRSWFDPCYMTRTWFEDLIRNGKVTLKKRGNA